MKEYNLKITEDQRANLITFLDRVSYEGVNEAIAITEIVTIIQKAQEVNATNTVSNSAMTMK